MVGSFDRGFAIFIPCLYIIITTGLLVWAWDQGSRGVSTAVAIVCGGTLLMLAALSVYVAAKFMKLRRQRQAVLARIHDIDDLTDPELQRHLKHVSLHPLVRLGQVHGGPHMCNGR